MKGQRIRQFRQAGAVRTAGTPFRQRREPKPVADMRNGAELAAEQIAARIRRHCRHRGHGCYLFVDDAGAVYVIGETSGAANRWAVEHTDWWLGCWTARVTAEDVMAELMQAERQLSAATA